MTRFREFLTAIAFLALVSISASAFVQVLRHGWPKPATAANRDLRQWLTTRDLANESLQTKREIVQRVEKDLLAGDKFAEIRQDLSEEHRERLEDNLGEIMELWLTDKVDRYFQLEPKQRNAYLDAEIDKLANLQSLSLQGESGRNQRDLDALGALFGRAQRLVSEAAPEQQQRFRQFQIAVQNRLIARQLEQAMSGFE